ncbi:3',5'-cyclic adenosine monophosphate phosphodiesterase CpdA [Legionella wadsworthii]|uniref:3',5'-cyclic adenosine monophosphate phosphodiesterase CpdA n=1 Tax=Legionella wadsworthii TaxID=28088 RepID=A0A378LS85_9GAMM|nr:metallophosphoesterase [Legionella wadsworthii]STY29825.1 3',5'-cyclic adenosine monophosphate phosphodiesterase CpdA [Legionella wadsworthii]
MSSREKKLKIIQLTDLHLFQDDSRLFEIYPDQTFQTVIKNAQEDLADADAVFLTGDLSQDETMKSYEIIANSLKDFNHKIFWIPGNHDSIANMKSVFHQKNHFVSEKLFLTEIWDFVFLNTKKEGVEFGLLEEKEFEFLACELKKKRTKPIAIVMHHHPIEVSTPLIDKYILQNKEEFFSIIKWSRVHLIICGHVHNDYSLHYHNIHIETSPATSIQFKKGAIKLELEKQIGYKIYYFSQNDYMCQTKIWHLE